MKITEITVKIEAHKDEIKQGREARYLVRHENKVWSCNDSGLFPSEIKLASKLQKIINEYNSTDKRNE